MRGQGSCGVTAGGSWRRAGWVRSESGLEEEEEEEDRRKVGRRQEVRVGRLEVRRRSERDMVRMECVDVMSTVVCGTEESQAVEIGIG